MVFSDGAAGGDDVFCLVAIQAAFADLRFQLLRRERRHAFHGGIAREQAFGHLIDALIGALGGKDGRHQRFIGVGKMQLCPRLGIEGGQRIEYPPGLLRVHRVLLSPAARGELL